MQIPKRVKVGNLTFKVKFETNLTGGTDNLGEMRPMAEEIVIEAGLTKGLQERTFCHEIFEIINFNYSLDLEHNKLDILGAALHGLIKDNPQIFQKETIKK